MEHGRAGRFRLQKRMRRIEVCGCDLGGEGKGRGVDRLDAVLLLLFPCVTELCAPGRQAVLHTLVRLTACMERGRGVFERNK